MAKTRIKTKVVAQRRRLPAEVRMQYVKPDCRYGILVDEILFVLYPETHEDRYSTKWAQIEPLFSNWPRKAICYANWRGAGEAGLAEFDGF